jgi:hypothetical protein
LTPSTFLNSRSAPIALYGLAPISSAILTSAVGLVKAEWQAARPASDYQAPGLAHAQLEIRVQAPRQLTDGTSLSPG